MRRRCERCVSYWMRWPGGNTVAWGLIKIVLLLGGLAGLIFWDAWRTGRDAD